MKKLLFMAACLMALASCQNSGTTDASGTAAAADTTATQAAEPAAAQPSCFLLAEGKDSTWVSLVIAADGTVTGSYDWIPWEKDSSIGTLSGKQEGELLKLVYDYVIEGSNQRQEVLLKLAGGQLSEAQGELIEGEGGLLKLKDPTKVTWTAFASTACK